MDYQEALELDALFDQLRNMKAHRSKIDRIEAILRPRMEYTIDQHKEQALGIQTSFHTFYPERQASSLHDMLSAIPQTFQSIEQEIKRLNGEEQDILHVLELGERVLSDEDRLRLADDLTSVRKSRKQLRLHLDMLTPLHVLLRNNATFVSRVAEAVTQIREKENTQEHRGYRLRTRHDLEAMFNRPHPDQKEA